MLSIFIGAADDSVPGVFYIWCCLDCCHQGFLGVIIGLVDMLHPLPSRLVGFCLPDLPLLSFNFDALCEFSSVLSSFPRFLSL